MHARFTPAHPLRWLLAMLVALASTGLIAAQSAVPQQPAFAWAYTAPGDLNNPARGVGAGPDGSVCVTGNFSRPLTLAGTALQPAGRADIFVARLAADGTPQWVKRFGGAGNDVGVDSDIDSQGNCLVTGAVSGSVDFGNGVSLSVSGGNIATVKLGPDGAARWARALPCDGRVAGNEVAVDSAGNVLVTGNLSDCTLSLPGGASLPSRGGQDVALVKYGSDGTFAWATSLGGSGSEQGRALASDPSGNVILGGETDSPTLTVGAQSFANQGLSDAYLATFTPAGALRWARHYGGTGDDALRGAGADAQGNIYIGGRFTTTITIGERSLTSAGGKDGFIASLDPAGGVRWVKQLGGAGAQEGFEVEVGPAGDLYLAGSCGGATLFEGEGQSITKSSAGAGDDCVAAYTSGGAVRWVALGGGSGDEVNFDLAADGNGAATVAGVTAGGAQFGSLAISSDPGLYIAHLEPSAASPPPGATPDQTSTAPVQPTVSTTPSGYNFGPVTTLLAEAVAEYDLDGAVVVVRKDGQLVYQQAFGGYTLDTVVPIASATKWTSGAIMMALVGDGVLSLDDRAARYIPSFDRPDKAAITLRQLLAHTSGLPGQDVGCLGDRNTTLAACVDQIAAAGMLAEPGTAFAYGGNSFHVAGRMAEVASGKSWEQLFVEYLKAPLGLEDYTYGRVNNPRIAGGASSSAGDYARFVQMLLDRGAYGSRAILSAAAVAEMETDQVGDLPIINSPGAPSTYGVATWLDLDADGDVIQAYGAGAGGTIGWLDRGRNLSAVFLVQDSGARLRELQAELQASIRAVVDAGPVDPDQRLYLPLLSSGAGGAAPAAPSPAAPVPTTPAPATPAPATPPPAPTPGAPATSLGQLVRESLTWEGAARSYLRYVPLSYDPARPAPLLLALHGGGGNANEFAATARFEALAEQEGFIVVYVNGHSIAPPEGRELPDGNHSWNSRDGGAPDDVGLISAVIDKMAADYTIDPSRIYLTGFSAGASMTGRMACALAGRLAAVAPVSGNWPFGPDGTSGIAAVDCRPAYALPLLYMRGTEESSIPTRDTEDDELEAFWAAHNDCAATPAVDTRQVSGETIERETYGGCADGSAVVVLNVVGNFHTWHNSATQEVWSFLKQHARPPCDEPQADCW